MNNTLEEQSFMERKMKTPGNWYNPQYCDSTDSDLTVHIYDKYSDEEVNMWDKNPASTKKLLLFLIC